MASDDENKDTTSSITSRPKPPILLQHPVFAGVTRSIPIPQRTFDWLCFFACCRGSLMRYSISPVLFRQIASQTTASRQCQENGLLFVFLCDPRTAKHRHHVRESKPSLLLRIQRPGTPFHRTLRTGFPPLTSGASAGGSLGTSLAVLARRAAQASQQSAHLRQLLPSLARSACATLVGSLGPLFPSPSPSPRSRTPGAHPQCLLLM